MDESTSVTATELAAAVRRISGRIVTSALPLDGGMIGDVHRITLDTGQVLVSKYLAGGEAHLDVEAAMITTLAGTGVVPVPRIEFAAPELLLMELMPGDHVTAAAEAGLGAMIAALHRVSGPGYGFDRPTLNGTVVLPNGWSERWIPFFCEQRLRFTAELATAAGRLDRDSRARVDRLGDRVEDLLVEPEHPSLLHGDLWRANVLSHGATVTALLDPSVLYGHPELEIAYAIGTGLGRPFLQAYTAEHPLDDGFFAVRQHVYMTYPALLHVLYFGDRYQWMLDRALTGAGV